MPFEHSNKRIAAEIGLLVGGAAALLLGAWAAVGALGDLAVSHVPPEVEQTLGEAMAKVVRQTKRPCEAPKVLVMVRDLAVEAGLDLNLVRVGVLEDDSVNAFALPGGSVFVLTGLLHKAQGPAEVAGVLAHELGHVVLRHHLRAAIRQLGLGAIVRSLLGDTGGLSALLVAGSGQLLDLAFSRDQEGEADAFAVQLVARLGFEPAAMGKLLERMEEPGAPPSFLRTHPSGPERRQALERLAASLPVTHGDRAASLSWPADEVPYICAPESAR